MLNDMEVLKSKLQGLFEKYCICFKIRELDFEELRLNAEIQMLRLTFRRKDINF